MFSSNRFVVLFGELLFEIEGLFLVLVILCEGMD